MASQGGYSVGGAVIGGIIGGIVGSIVPVLGTGWGIAWGIAIGGALGYTYAWVNNFQVPETPKQRARSHGFEDDQWAPFDQPIPICYGVPKASGDYVYQGGVAETVGTSGAVTYVDPAEVYKFCNVFSEGPVVAVCDIEAENVGLDAIQGATYDTYLGVQTQPADRRFVTVRQRVELTIPEWYTYDSGDPSATPDPKTVSFTPGQDGATAWVHLRFQGAIEGEDRTKRFILQLEYTPNGEGSPVDGGVHEIGIPSGQTGPVDVFLPIGDPTGTRSQLLYSDREWTQETVWDPNAYDHTGAFVTRNILVVTPHYVEVTTGVSLEEFDGGVSHEVTLTYIQASSGSQTSPEESDFISCVLAVVAVEIEERLGAQTFPNSAYAALSIPRKNVQSAQPSIRARVIGRKVQVWDGAQFAERWSNNPIWCTRDVITNTRYGLANLPAPYDGATDEEWGGFKLAASVCDEVVSTLEASVSLDAKRWEFTGHKRNDGIVGFITGALWTEGSTTLALYRAGAAQGVTGTYQGVEDGRLILSSLSNPAFAFAAGDYWRTSTTASFRFELSGTVLASYAVSGFSDDGADYSGYVADNGAGTTRLVAYHDRNRGRFLFADDFASSPAAVAVGEQRFRFDMQLREQLDGHDALRLILSHCRALKWEADGYVKVAVETARDSVGEFNGLEAEGTENLFANPDAQTWTGWSVSNSGTQTLSVAATGLPWDPDSVLKAIVAAGQVNALVYQQFELALGETYVARWWVYFPVAVAAGDASARVYKVTGSWEAVGTATTITARGQWVQVTHTFTADATEATHVVCVGVNGGIPTDFVLMTRAQLEHKPRATGWVDGIRFGGMLEGTFECSEERDDQAPDALICRYVEPGQNFQNREIQVGDPVEGGLIEEREWLGCLNVRQVQRLGAFALRLAGIDARAGFRAPLSAYACEPGDPVDVYHPVGGSGYGCDLTDKNAPVVVAGTGRKMVVAGITHDMDADNLAFVLRDYDEALYSDDPGLLIPVDVRDTRQLGVPEPVTDLTLRDLGDLTDDGVWNPVVEAEWVQPYPGTVAFWEVYYSRDEGETWLPAGRVQMPRIRLTLAGFVGTLYLCVVPVGLTGLAGAWGAGCGTVTVSEDTTAPATPTGLTAHYDASGVWWEWNANTELDLSHYLVSLDAGAAWQAVKGTTIGKPPEECTLRSYTLRVAAVDRTGNISDPTGDVTASLPAPGAPSTAHLEDNVDHDQVVLYVLGTFSPSPAHVGFLFQWRVEGGTWANISDQPAQFAVWHAGLAAGQTATVEWRYAEVDVVGAGAWSDAVTGVALTASVAQALADAAEALVAAGSALEIADGAINGFFQDAIPSGAGETFGDIWIDTDGHTPPTSADIYRYEDEAGGSAGTLAWRTAPANAVGLSYLTAYLADLAAAEAAGAATDAQATADGKIVTFYAASGSLPTAEAVGDLWYVTDTKLMLRWNGSSWGSVGSLNTGALADLDAVDTGQIAAGAVTISEYAQDDGPSDEVAGTPTLLIEIDPFPGSGVTGQTTIKALASLKWAITSHLVTVVTVSLWAENGNGGHLVDYKMLSPFLVSEDYGVMVLSGSLQEDSDWSAVRILASYSGFNSGVTFSDMSLDVTELER